MWDLFFYSLNDWPSLPGGKWVLIKKSLEPTTPENMHGYILCEKEKKLKKYFWRKMLIKLIKVDKKKAKIAILLPKKDYVTPLQLLWINYDYMK